MKISVLAATFVGALATRVNAQAGAWGQCGGTGWTGPKTCVSGYVCTYSNEWYSQCLPGTGPPPTTTVAPPPGSTTSTTRTTSGPTTTSPNLPAGTGVQIRGVTAPVYHLYLQNSGGVAVLGPEADAARFTISGSISLNSSNGSKLYLNIGNVSTSYKPLTFDATATTTGWGLEGDTIITTNASPYGRQLNFLACTSSKSGYYTMYLQTGNAVPSGTTCTMVTMHLPCLC